MGRTYPLIGRVRKSKSDGRWHLRVHRAPMDVLDLVYDSKAEAQEARRGYLDAVRVLFPQRAPEGPAPWVGEPRKHPRGWELQWSLNGKTQSRLFDTEDEAARYAVRLRKRLDALPIPVPPPPDALKHGAGSLADYREILWWVTRCLVLDPDNPRHLTVARQVVPLVKAAAAAEKRGAKPGQPTLDERVDVEQELVQLRAVLAGEER